MPFYRQILIFTMTFACFVGLSRLAAEPEFAFRFDPVTLSVAGPPGTSMPVDFMGTITTWNNTETFGVAGWAMSVAAEGNVSMVDVNLDGTDAEALFTNGFNHFELTYGPGNTGFVGGVILGYDSAVTLPANGTASVVHLYCTVLCPDIDATTTGLVLYRNGLTGSGEPIDNTVSFNITSYAPRFGRLNMSATGIWLPSFIRGDTNGDNTLNIADCVLLLDYMFKQGTMSCLDAGDIDDDGKILLGDAISLLSYLFAEGTDPAAPFPECGMDLTLDENEDLGCEDYPTCQE